MKVKKKKEIVNGKQQIYEYDFKVQHKVKPDVINTIRSSKVFIMGEYYSKGQIFERNHQYWIYKLFSCLL